MISFYFSPVKVLLLLLLLNSTVNLTAQINIASSGSFNGAPGNNLFAQNTTGAAQMIHNFAITDPTSATQIIAGEPGKLYGLVTAGGPDQSGGIFSVNEDGSNFKLIFNYPVGQAYMQYGADGTLYLMILEKLYSIGTDGTGFTLVADLPGTSLPFTLDKNGWLYGSSRNADTARLYKIKTDGTGYQVFHTFDYLTEGGWEGRQALALSATGRLYGTCGNGGPGFSGTLFSVNTDGSSFTVHITFSYLDTISNPNSIGQLSFINKKIFFSTNSGGIGGVFGRIVAYDTASGSLTSVYKFFTNDSSPNVNPTAAADKLLGFNNIGLYVINQDGSSFSQLKRFANPYNWQGNSLLYDTAGNSIFYLGDEGNFKNSVLTKTNFTDSSAVTLHDFGAVSGGYNPDGITKGPGKIVYGITINGGSTGGGTLYKVNQDGTGFLQLHDFTGDNGQFPFGQLLLASDGKLYGVCSRTGVNGTEYNSLIFSIDTSGINYSVLRVFNVETEGRLITELTEGNNGVLYGTTEQSYTYQTTSRSLIFKINRNGTGYEVLKSFRLDGLDGQSPRQALTYFNNYLYGICVTGGQYNSGTLFRIGETGNNFDVLHQFQYGNDGTIPLSGLVLASNNKLYGTTLIDGAKGNGTVFSFDPFSLTFSTIYSFSNSDGFNSTRFIQGSDGRLYTNKYDRLFSIDTTGDNPISFLYNKNSFSSNYILEIDASNNSCEGSNVQYTSGITGAGYTYQWQVNNGAGFTNLANDAVYSGVSNSTLQLIAAPTSLTGNTYRCAVNTGSGVVYTNNYLLNFQNVWTGATDTDWNKSTNWSCGTVPGIKSDVVIPPLKSKYPMIDIPVKCKSLSLQKGATINVASGVSIELTGKNN